jgi:hypothetical protein
MYMPIYTYIYTYIRTHKLDGVCVCTAAVFTLWYHKYTPLAPIPCLVSAIVALPGNINIYVDALHGYCHNNNDG